MTFASTFMISARSGSGVADLKSFFAAHVPPGPWLYPEDQISDAPMRPLAAEITREKLFLRLHQELPYQSTVETEVWKELRDGSVRIEQTIYVERESQRKIVLGKGGQAIKAIGAAARKDIAEAVEHPVHLFLFVKVREGWGDDPERYREMGLEFPKEGYKSPADALDTCHAMDRRRHRARRQAPWRDERHSRTDDAGARPPSRPGARRRQQHAVARRVAAGQFAARDLAGAARRASRQLCGRGS